MNNLKISHKLNLGFALIVALFLAMASITAWRVDKVSQATQRMEEASERLKIGSAWQGDVRQNSARSLAVGFAQGNEMLDLFRDAMANTSRNTDAKQQAYIALATTPQSKQRAQKVVERRQIWLASRDEVNKMKQSAEAPQVQRYVQQTFIPATDTYIASLQELVDGETQDVAAAQADVRAMFAQLYTMGGMLVALAVLAAIVISWRLSHSISQGIGRARDVAMRIGSGDLSQDIRVASKDEIGDLLGALREMQNNLSNVVRTVRQGSDSVALASAEIAQGNQDLSSRTESQASALEETSASMEELGSTVQQNADNARQANQLAQSASQIAMQGGHVVAEVVDTMKGISESSTRIADITGVIDGIAFQTNILALNAAVEAARAGEQGRGFAVVASEVRSLAQRSAEAAKEIKSLITVSVDRVQQGTKLVDQAGSTMEEVVSSIRRVTDIMGEISAASTEQSAGVSQVGEAITQMDHVTQQNAALVEEMSASASSLHGQAQELVQAVATFKLSGHQNTAAVERRPTAQAAVRPALAPVGQRTDNKTARRSPVPSIASTAATPTTAAQVTPRTKGDASKAVEPTEMGEWENF